MTYIRQVVDQAPRRNTLPVCKKTTDTMFRALHVSSKLGFHVVKTVLGMDTTDPVDMLQQMGGVYGKVAQASSLDDPDRAVFDECVPLNPVELEARVIAYCIENNLDATPLVMAGSGSIGGVYIVRRPDGRRVALKIRYPGIEDMVERDLSFMGTMSMFSGHGRIIPQIRQSILRELDYRLETSNLAALGMIWAGSSIDIPAVVDGLSQADDVVVMEYMEGTPAARYLRTAAEDQKAALCMSMVEFCLGSWSHGYVYADPHWGNFLVSASGRLQVLDFGNVEHSTPAECTLHRHYLSIAGTTPVGSSGTRTPWTSQTSTPTTWITTTICTSCSMSSCSRTPRRRSMPSHSPGSTR